MILIADSGSTKTFWATAGNDTRHKVIQTQGMNPYFTSPDRIGMIIRDELLGHVDNDNVTHIHFYGAGCSTEKNNALIRDQLGPFFRTAQIAVYHDILGAARALFGNREGIACILGTGCNSCFYDGSEVFTRVPSLGYLFGDEGAGSYLGKKFMERYLKKDLPSEIITAFNNTYQLTLEDILNSLYNKPFPNRFLASFSLFLKDHDHHPAIHDLIYHGFIEFIETHIQAYENFTHYPTGFIGSIAFYFRDILLEAATDKHLIITRILQSPVEGLVEYHGK